MAKKASQWLESKKKFKGQKPGNTLVKWLNDPHVSPKFVEDLLRDAQVVFRWVAEYGSLHELKVARKQGKLPPAFWNCHRKVNQTLAAFTHAPHIDLHEFPDGERVSWMLVTEQSPIALLSVQVRCVLQLIEQGAVLKIRRCEQCWAWYFAHFSHQEFCSTSCRYKRLSGSEKYKEERRKYMRDYYWLQKSGKVK